MGRIWTPFRGRATLAALALLGSVTWAEIGHAQAAKPEPKRSPKAEAQKPTAPRPRKRPPGVRGMFEAAQELYEAGNYPKALAAYDALLRKYPAHEPAMIQTAKTLYRLDRIKDAFGVFTHINPQHLDPETSYEFGWSYYTFKSWEGAFVAFQRVPRGHALYDLANYYGAICAIKLKKYEDAEDMLEKAVVLPDKLAKSRALYIKHVQALKLMQQKNALAKEREKEKESLSAEAKKPTTPAKSDSAAPPSGEYKHAGFQSITKSAKVSHTIKHQYIDNHGTSESNFDAKDSKFELLSGPILPLPFKIGKDRQGAFGLQLTLAAEDYISYGKETRIIVEETEGDLERLQTTEIGTTDTKSGIVGAAPWIEVPLPENLWLALGGEVKFTYYDFERGNRTGTRKGYTDLNGKVGDASYGGEISYTETVDTKTKPTMTLVESFVYGEVPLMPSLTGRTQLTYHAYDYLSENSTIDGPDASTAGEVLLTQELPLTFKFKLFGSVEQQTNYIFHAVPTFGEVSADGTILTGRATLSVAPFPFVSASIKGLVAKSKWRLGNEAARDPFELNVADYLEEFAATVTVNMDF